MIRAISRQKIFLIIITLIFVSILSCAQQFGSVVIEKPDEYRHTYEAKETIILKAIAHVLKEKKIGTNFSINRNKLTVDSDYTVEGDWRTKSSARVRNLNWKECEVALVVVTEKKTNTGWEIRRLLDKEQYDSIFSIIDLRIYEEMYKVE